MSTANNNFCISRKNTALLYILMAAILLGFLMTQFLVPSDGVSQMRKPMSPIRAPFTGKRKTAAGRRLPYPAAMT